MHSSPPPPPLPHDRDPRAVEITAMLADSVVSVKHIASPRGGQVTAATAAILAAAALLLGASALAFAAGVRNEAHNAGSLRRWTEVDGKAAADWRPRRMGLGWDWLAFGGAAGGVALLVLGASRRGRERGRPEYVVGEGAGVDHPLELPAEAGRALQLVAPRGDRFVLRAIPGGAIERLVDGRAEPVAGREVALAAGARYRLASGQCSFLVSSVPPPRRHRAGLLPVWDRSILVAAGLSLVAHLGLVALLDSIAPDARALGDDPLGAEGRLTLVRVQPREEPAAEPPPSGQDGESGEGRSGTRMALTEGRMGERDASAPDGRYQIADRGAPPALARARAVERARRAGVLGILHQRQAFASLTGTADIASGLDSVDIYGGLIGADARAAAGGWGYGLEGVGPGGGGPGWGTIGVVDSGGGLGWGATCGEGTPPTCGAGLIGHGTGTGSGLPRRRPKAPTVAITNTSSIGDLDANIIRRHVRRKLPAIRHCYERALVSHQELAGTVLVRFQISPLGVVQGAVARGMGEGGVEGCVAEAIRSIQFPRPKGGGMVDVRYPFVFQPAG